MRTLKEESGIEFYTGDDGRLKAKTVTDKLKSSKAKNKLSDLKVVDGIRNLAPREKETAIAVKKILKSKGKLSDVSQEFNTDPKPDLTFKANGDVIITPDNGKASYKIPEEDVESAITENTEFRRGYDARVGGSPIIITESKSWLNGYGAASKDLKALKERRMPKGEIPTPEDYLATIRAKGLEATLGEMVSKRTIVYTPILINVCPGVEARLRVFSQGNYTLFDDADSGWEGLDLQEFEKDIDELLAIYA